jgi:hypothetical protein
MSTMDDALQRSRTSGPVRRHLALLGGGSDGNELLTTLTGMLLFVLLAVIGVTIVRIGQLSWLHLFVGLLLLGPVVLKLASTGYRFMRYYTHDRVYVAKGAPWTPLRLIAPIVALSTGAVFLTGLVLLVAGPADRRPWLLLHKASFIIWVAFTAFHVIGHMPEVGRVLRLRSEIVNLPGIRTDLEGREAEASETAVLSGPGSLGRWLAISGALVLGLIIAVALIPDFSAWTGGIPIQPK